LHQVLVLVGIFKVGGVPFVRFGVTYGAQTLQISDFIIQLVTVDMVNVNAGLLFGIIGVGIKNAFFASIVFPLQKFSTQKRPVKRLFSIIL
jgi:hypothetical protein